MPEDQDPNVDPDLEGGEGNEGGKPSDGDGGGDADNEPVTIGEKEYTPKQVAELEKKATGYDALLPDYTQKSQKLSELEKDKGSKGEPGQDQEQQPAYRDPNWKPKSLEELRQAMIQAEEIGVKKATAKAQEREEATETVKKQVDDFVDQVKQDNKEFDENDFFEYATKHKFPLKTIEDLKSVHSSYSSLQEAYKAGEQSGVKNKLIRDKAGVSKPGAGGQQGSVDFGKIRKAGSAFEAVQDYLNK